MAKYMVRLATAEDAELLTRLAALFGQEPMSDAVRGWLATGVDFGLVAEDANGSPVGAAWWRLPPVRNDDNPPAREVFAAVFPEHWRSGVGRLLFEELLARARAQPEIRAFAARPASALIRELLPRMGFVQVPRMDLPGAARAVIPELWSLRLHAGPSAG